MTRAEESEMTQAASYDLPRARTFSLRVTADNPKDSDFALARAAACGAMAAVGELYVRHGRRVYSLCMRMTHNTADAEDLTQEVFVHLMRKVGSFRGESQFTTWLHRLTVNHVLMHFRHGAARKVDKTEADGAEISISLERKHSTSPQLVDNIALDSALSQLPPGYRAAFVLHDVEGYEHEEVARLLGYSVGTSKSQLHKARRKLRRLLNAGGWKGR